MAARKRLVLVLLILAVCVGCDQKSKHLAEEHLRGREGISLFADTLRIDYTENQGAFLGLGSLLPAPWRTALLAVGCSLAIAATLAYVLLMARCGYLQLLGFSLMCAGGIGNLIDRWAYGYTRDFLNVGVGLVRTGIFNVADVVLMAGCLLVWWSYRPRGITSAT